LDTIERQEGDGMRGGESERRAARPGRADVPGGPGPGESWVAWLEAQAERYEAHAGAAGRVVGTALRGLADHARELGARGPEEYERLAEEAALEEAAWAAAREAEWDDFLGGWGPGAGPDDDPGSGHPVGEPEPGYDDD
jgi:hypothetical protein